MAKIEYDLVLSDNNIMHSLYKFQAIVASDDIEVLEGFIDILTQHAQVFSISNTKTAGNHIYVFSCSTEELTIKQLRDAAIIIKAAGFSLGRNMAMIASLKVASYASRNKPKNKV